MSYRLQNIMRQEALKATNHKTMVSCGKVIGYDPAKYLADVEIYPEDDEPAMQTGWISIFSPWVGHGWGMFCPPGLGDIVDVHYQEGSLQNGFVSLRSYTNLNPPLSVPSGEFWLVHQSGSFVKLKNDGSVEINSENLKLGDIAEGTLLKLLNSIAKDVFNNHTHHVEAAPGESAMPTQQMGDDSLTENVSAS